MQLKGHIVDAGNLARGMRDLVLWSLVVEFKKATVKTVSCFYFATFISSSPKTIVRHGKGGVKKRTHRLGSIALPSALRLSFFMAMGPMFCRWSALGFVMMLSQMTAEFVAFWPSAEGQSAVT